DRVRRRTDRIAGHDPGCVRGDFGIQGEKETAMDRQVNTAVADRIVRIGGASGFWGDSRLGPEQLVRSGAIDYLVFDYLAELTMSILAAARAKKPEEGYATDFVTVALRSVLEQAVRQGIRIVSNAGGVNPAGCAAAVRTLAAELGRG